VPTAFRLSKQVQLKVISHYMNLATICLIAFPVAYFRCERSVGGAMMRELPPPPESVKKGSAAII
jgi:hypothetical protein